MPSPVTLKTVPARASLPVTTYSIHRSSRARHVWLRFSKSGELVVVVPRRFETSRVAAIVEANRDWIERAAARVHALRDASSTQDTIALPQRIVLPALKQEWDVEYRSTNSDRVRVTERDQGRLILSGDIDHNEKCRSGLLRWLHRKGHERLVPELYSLAVAGGFSVARVTVRAQRTRWASCSRSGTISLNIRLLFMPPELVTHVMLHELCHTRKMDHSADFWFLVAQHDPNWKDHRRRLRIGWRALPAWLNSRAVA